MPSTEMTDIDSTDPPTNEELAEQLARVVELTKKLAETQRDLTDRLDEHDPLESPPGERLSDANPSLESMPDYFR